MGQTAPSPTEDAAIAAYDHKKGWSTTGQPWAATVEEYLEIAHAVKPMLREEISNFINSQGFSVIEIEYEAFRDYERGETPFREWLEEYCNSRGLDSRSDFAIMGPRVKDQESAHRKTASGEKLPDRVIDYIGVQCIALKQTKKPENKQSITNMRRFMSTIEEDKRTIARKNLYWQPHDKTGFRGHKTLWELTAPKDSEMAPFSILAEIKLEHESQMDVDRFTRRFINVDRTAKSYMARAWDNTFGALAKSVTGTCTHEEKKRKSVTFLGVALYNRVFWDAGLDQLLNPQLKDRYPPPTDRAIIGVAREIARQYFNKDSAIDFVTNVSQFLSSIKKTCVNRRRKPEIVKLPTLEKIS